MKFADGWWWPDGEQHMLEWMAEPKNRVILNGRPAYQGRKILRTIELARERGDMRVAIDAGAHIGLWAWTLAHTFQAVEAFEPVEAHQECFRTNVIIPLIHNPAIQLHPFALGEREDMVAIRVNPTSSGDSWVKGKGDVPMRTIDSFGLREVDLIKVDAEGYEEFILRGAEDTIGAWRPLIVVEQKRDFACKFGLKPQGAITYLKERFGYRQADEMAGDYFMLGSEAP